MKPRTKLILLKINPAVRPVLLAVAQEFFPTAEVIEPAQLADAVAQQANTPATLLVLHEPDEALLAEATQALDAGGLPRWAVVVLGAGSSDVAEIIPVKECQPRSLARVFRSALLQHELLRENLRLRGDLKSVARRISHEMRTPVGCIHTSSDLLDELSAGQGAGLANVAEIFRQSSREISQLIDRVSFVLRASSDPIAPSTVEMGVIVTHVLRQLQEEIRRTSAVVRQPDAWPEVAGVTTWLQVIWWNLLQNALQHGGPAAEVRVTWVREPDGYRFAVVDQGAGVDPAQQAALFVPFDQLHAQRTAGLGLSIVQRLVALQGGGYRYQKLPGLGTCFEFTLPATTPVAAS